MSIHSRIRSTCLLVFGIFACDAAALAPKADKPESRVSITRAEKDVLDKLKAREEAKASLMANLARYIQGGKWKSRDKGIINDYTRATAIEFSNQSEFDITDLEGQITYIDKGGKVLATVPFTAKGELRANAQAELKVDAGEISGKAPTARFEVKKVRIIGGV